MTLRQSYSFQQTNTSLAFHISVAVRRLALVSFIRCRRLGTAQVRALGSNRGRHFSTIEWKYRDNALFCCFGPWHEPRYACAVVIEHGGAGSAVAGPIAKQIMRETLMRDPANRTPARLAQLEAGVRA